jgi:3alpha(or 20beta)-hydroxysteroid dehydrogenase
VSVLAGKVAIITGSAGGHGRATTQRFVDAGATVYATDLADHAGRVAAEERGATFVRHDVTSADSWRDVVARVVADTGRVDVLVNNAAIIEWHTMTETTADVWARTIAVNQTGPLLGMQAVAPTMKTQGRGSIVNISSIGGLGGSSPCFAYGVTKWAVRGMTRGAAQELGPYGIRVNAVLPGTIESTMIEGMDVAAASAGIPLRRIGTPDEVARLSLWLASDDSAYATGADFLLDGGARA